MFEFFFARRITFRNQKSISTLVVWLSVISIMLAIAVMEVALSIVDGFEFEIHRKVMGFGSHIQVGNLLKDLDARVDPLPRDNGFMPKVRALPEIKNAFPYVELPGMIKSKETQEGVVLKGVEKNYDWSFFKNSLKSGNIPEFSDTTESNQVLISKKISELLNISPGSSCYMYFFREGEQRYAIRKVKVSGIYETGLEEFDKIRVICDMRFLQNVIKWQPDDVSGFEINLKDPQRLKSATEKVKNILPYNYQAYPITEIYPEIFEWVQLQHQNVWFILALMVIIAVVNMTSVVLILILEKAQTIGLLKAIGLSNFRVRMIFIFNAFFLIFLGVIFGNIFGMGLIWSQDHFGWLQVNQENYFVKVVPVHWSWAGFFLTNLGVMIVCTVCMLLPSIVISRISPTRALRID